MSDPGKTGRFSIIRLLVITGVVALLLAHASAVRRLGRAEAELRQLRMETGYLAESGDDQIAAVRVKSDHPLTYRARVRVPATPRFRVAYSSLWPQDAAAPAWFAAVDLPPGESVVTVRVLEDPRDERWKITTIVQSPWGSKRVATVLPPQHVEIFRGTHDAVSAGIGRQTHLATIGESIRLCDERWLVGEGSLLLYGNRAPESDLVGIFAELQPDDRPL